MQKKYINVESTFVYDFSEINGISIPIYGGQTSLIASQLLTLPMQRITKTNAHYLRSSETITSCVSIGAAVVVRHRRAAMERIHIQISLHASSLFVCFV